MIRVFHYEPRRLELKFSTRVEVKSFGAQDKYPNGHFIARYGIPPVAPVPPVPSFEELAPNFEGEL
ncbi:MAG: hypothetical protein O7E52_13980 [Candidatus Poribacteria bacterium]|nr:hypothetical protein [Candidatus Poribacteria bacterium]